MAYFHHQLQLIESQNSMKQMIIERTSLYDAERMNDKFPEEEKFDEYFKICQKKWIEDSLNPYSLNTMIETQKSLNKIFPFYNLKKLTNKTKES